MIKLKILSVMGALALLCSCAHIDDDRLPPVTVHIGFNTVGDWTVYGVAGAGNYRYFIKSEMEPPGYPYTALSFTGFGGVLLICDINGNPIAYDLACPVECKSNIRIHVNPDDLKAECSTCHSVYDIVTNYGHPLSGPAAQKNFGLQKYYVGPGVTGEYMLISR